MKRTHVLQIPFAVVLAALALLVSTWRAAENSAEAQSGLLAYGDSAFGALESGGPAQSYLFAGMENDQVVVDVFHMSDGLETVVTLRAPDGSELAQSVYDRLTPNGRNAHLAQVLPQSGQYTLEVRAEVGAGNYMLRLQGRAEAVALEMQYGETVTVDVPVNAPPQYYTFETRTCLTTLTVTNLSDGEPFTFPFALTLRNEQGLEIARLRGGMAHEDRITVAAESGTYEIEVRPNDPTVTGQIALLVTCASGAPGCGGDATGGAECPACPSCTEEIEEGGTPVCENINVHVGPRSDGLPGVEVTWDAVPGAEHYWVHMYGYNDAGEVYFGPAGVPGDATSFVMPHLPDGFFGFRFVVEAVAGESTLCLGESELWMAEPPPSDACEHFEVSGEVIDNDARTVRWSWGSYPGTAYYAALEGYDVGGGAFAFYRAGRYGPETVAITATYPRDDVDSDRWMLQVVAAGPDDEILCIGSDIIEFQSEIEEFVPQFCTITLLSPREGMANGMQTFYWTAVDGATGYRVRIYNESGALVAEATVGPLVNNVTIDVSTAAIGGGFTFNVTVEALRGSATWCQDGVTELRAAEVPGGGSSGGNGNPACYYLVALADPSNAGYAAPLTAANCGNGYSAGTVVDVQAYPNDGCWLNYWDGCGASGNANPVSVTMTGDCTITAHMGCIQ